MAKLLPGTWTAEQNRKATDNYNGVMNRTWYSIAGSDPAQGKMDAFWEFNSWLPGKIGKRFDNHTITRDIGAPIKDFGIWNGRINKAGLYVLQPVFELFGFRIPSPIAPPTHWLSFPQDDAWDQVWTYYASLPGKRIFFMFALTPHLSDAIYRAELERLQDEHRLNITETPFNKVQWDASYTPGDTGEDKINAQGQI